MESTPETKWKPTNAQTLLWCCFCDARFENSALLSRHLDSYNVNWKLYWQLFYSERDGKMCLLCNILHTDRKSLECHFKMVHCITRSCAKREPDVITVEGGRSEEYPPQASLNETAVAEACPEPLCPPPSESEQKVHEGVRPENIDDIDVLFEINHADAVDCETSSVATPESFHLTLPSSSSETEQSSVLEEEVQMLSHSIEKLPSPRQTSRRDKDDNLELVVPDGMGSAKLMSTGSITVLQPEDEVKVLESGGMDLLSQSEFSEEHEIVTLAAQVHSDSCENPDVIELEDDEVLPVASSHRKKMVSPSVDLPPTPSFPEEDRHVRPTAVVNPFGAREGDCSSTERCEGSLSEQLPSARLLAPELSQATTSQRSGRNHRGLTTLSSIRSDLISVLPDEGKDSDVSTSELSSVNHLRVCRTPPHALGDIETELADLPNPTSGVGSRDVPDLSRLTPSKIAAFMNKDIFSAKQQSDIEKHLEEKTSANPNSAVSKVPSAEALSDTSADEWDTDSEGDEMSREDTAPRVLKEDVSSELYAHAPRHSSLNTKSAKSRNLCSGEEEPSPFGFNILSVESLLPEQRTCVESEGRYGAKLCAGGGRDKQRSLEEIDEEPRSNTSLTRKRKLSKTPDGGSETPATSVEKPHTASSRKKSRTCPNPVVMQPTSGGSKRVFKEPIGLCVGVIHPGCLVEVSSANIPQTSKTQDSLDGMVMKVETKDSSIRYFIHFPNMDKRLDRWVSSEDIIQVYRTEEQAKVVSPGRTSSSPIGQTKRRLAFKPAPEARRSNRRSSILPAQGQPGADVSARPPPKQPRPAARVRGHPAKGNARPRDRRGKLVSKAKAHLLRIQQHAKATNESQSRSTTQIKRPVKTGKGVGKAKPANGDSSGPASLMPRRLTRTALSAGMGAFGSYDADGSSDKPTTVSKRQKVRPVAASGEDCPAVRSRSVKTHTKVGAKKIAETQSSGGDGEAQKEKKMVDMKLTKTVSSTGSRAPSANDGPRGAHRVKKHPPDGVNFLPVDESMLASLHPGMLVYVIGLVLKNDWLRLYPAEILEVLDGEQFHVRYVGYNSLNDEMIAAELIHSLMDVQKKIHPSSLRASWLFKYNEAAPPKKCEETTPLTTTMSRSDRKSEEDEPRSPDAKTTAQNAQGNYKSPGRGSFQLPRQREQSARTSKIVPKPPHCGRRSHEQPQIAKRQHCASRKTTPPTLSRERTSGAGRDSPDSLPEVPPSLAQETRVAPATRRSTAATGRDDVDFWTSVADVQSDMAVQKARAEWSPATVNKRTPFVMLGDRAATPTVVLSRITASAAFTASASCGDRTETAASEGLMSDSSPDPCVPLIRGRGRPPKKRFGRSTGPPLPVGNAGHPLDSGAKSDAGESSIAEQRCRRPAERLSVQPTSPDAQKTNIAVSTASTGADLSSALPGGKAVVAEHPSVKRNSQPVIERGSTSPPDISNGKSPVAGKSRTRKLGRPPKKFKAAGNLMRGGYRHQSASSADQNAGPLLPKQSSEQASKDEEKLPQRRSLRSVVPAASADTAADSVCPGSAPSPAAQAVTVAAVVADGRQDCTSDGSDSVSTDLTTPCTKKDIKKLRDGDVLYVVYEVQEDGTKFIYPAKIIEVNKDLYYRRFLIHYLGWAHRYDEWITDEVIHSIVDRSRPDFNAKSLKRLAVSSPRRREQLSQVRPCSVDLSVNNICFFSALRRGRCNVDDKRILALRAEARARGPNACWE